MSEIYFNTKKKDSASSEGKETEYETSFTTERLFNNDVFPEKEQKGLIRAVSRSGRLGQYVLLTDTHDIEGITRSQELIVDIVDKILVLLDSLKEDLSNTVEAESIFANVLQYHKDLWKLRKTREVAFTDILVSLESAIKYYDTDELGLEKINILNEVYGSLKEASLQSDFPRIVRKKLRGVGFDMARPLVGVPEKIADVMEKLKSHE